MAPEATDFRALEQSNRRTTWILVAVFIVLFGMFGLLLDIAAGDITIDQNGRLVAVPLLTIAALLYAVIHSMISYYGGAPLILLSVHARELTPDTPKHQMVLDVIREMAIAARMPVPRAYLMDDPAPNAFATGRDPARSVICVTQGLVDGMDREELQGVIGHEMAHIADYDIRTMMVIAVLVGGIAMLSDFFFRWTFYGGRGVRIGGRDKNDGQACLIITG